MQNNEINQADAIPAQEDSFTELCAWLAGFLESVDWMPHHEVYAYLKDKGWKAKDAQRALLEYGSKESPEGDPMRWVYLWHNVSVQPVAGSRSVTWGGKIVHPDNIGALIQSHRRITLWIEPHMPKGPLKDSLELKERGGSASIATFGYRAPALPTVHGISESPMTLALDSLDIDYDMVMRFQKETGACDAGIVDMLRNLNVEIDVSYSWDNYDGCASCAMDSGDYDESELDIESIDHIQPFSLEREEAESVDLMDEGYREALLGMFGGDLDWTYQEECIETLQGIMGPEPSRKEGTMYDGATFTPDIARHIRGLDLEDWDSEHLVRLTLALSELCSRYALSNHLPPVAGTLTYPLLGQSWDWDGEAFRGDKGVRITWDDSTWYVDGFPVDSQGIVRAKEEGLTAQLCSTIRNMDSALRMI